MTLTTIPPTENEARGFWGTMERGGRGADVASVWAAGSQTIVAATTGSPEEVHALLDSRYGRHFANDVANELARGLTPTSES